MACSTGKKMLESVCVVYVCEEGASGGLRKGGLSMKALRTGL